jgi:hypothetical protein
MSLREPRCMVCGARLDLGAPFEKDPRKSEVCSNECYAIFMGFDSYDAYLDSLDEPQMPDL